MRFASIGGQSNYAVAGKAVADDAARIFDTARKNSVNFGELAQTARDMKSRENAAISAADAKVASQKVISDASIKVTKEEIYRDELRAKSRRKAGVVAALGKAGAGLADVFMGKPQKRDHSSSIALQERLTQQANELRAGIKPIDTNAFNTNTSIPNTSSGSTGSNNIGGTAASSTSTTGAGGTPQGSNNGWSKLSKVIRFGEGTSGDAGYTTQFTGSQFTDMSRHPRQLKSGGGYTSDAAGAYQFLSTTWDGAKKALGLTDFSPQSQEKAGRYLTQQRGVNPDQVFTTIDEFRGAMDKLAPEWASLPYSGVSPSGHGRGSSYYGQGGKSLEQLWEIYQQS